MKRSIARKAGWFVGVIIFISACKTDKSNKEQDDSSTVESLYLGQNPPGLIPEPFAPGLVTTQGWEYNGIFTPDLKEFYFLREVGETEEDKKTEFVVIKNINNQWQESVISTRVGSPFISPDGKTMHLGRRYMKRADNGEWSEIKELESPFDSIPIMRLTASSKGTYYFDEFKRDFTGDIRYSRLVNGKYEEPKLLNKKINTGKSFHPFIAPDESYLIFDSKRESGFGDSDIYISYRQQNGEWGTPINLGNKVNTKAWESSASVTPDGKYLFFSRNMGSDNYENVDIFWVDARIIDELRTKQYNQKAMKKIYLISILAGTLLFNACDTQTKESEVSNLPPLSDRYFGEEPPGLTPKLFDPEIVSPDGLFEGGKFSPDGKEYYFSRKNGKYEKRTHFVIRYENGRWGNESETKLRLSQFSKGGDTLYAGNKYRARTDSGWSEYKSLGTPFSDKHIMGLSFSDNKTAFFDEISFDENGKPDTVGAISYSRLVNGKYEPRQKLGEEINTGTWIAHPYIAPDESYLIWDVRREDGFGGSDIYISFRDKNDSWLPAMNMGDKINTALSESGGRVSDDGKYLFFTRGGR